MSLSFLNTAALTLVSVLLHTAFAANVLKASHILQFGTVVDPAQVDLPSNFFAVNPRQGAGNGTCPSQPSIECALSDYCCPNRCCPSTIKYCSEVLGRCSLANGTSVCRDSSTGAPILCTLCAAATKAAPGQFVFCPALSIFRFCTTRTPFVCVSSRGYIGCRDENGTVFEGTSCDGTNCCSIPDRCGTTGCIPGSGLPPGRAVESPPSATLGARPSAGGGGSSVAPTPSTIGQPSSVPPTPAPSIPPSTTEPTTTQPPTTQPPPASSVSAIPTLSSRPTASSSPVPDNGVCFPASASVERADGAIVSMRQLRTGDHIRVSGTEFSEVFLWTHRDAGYHGDSFVRLTLAEGSVLTATIGHVVPVCRKAQKDCGRENVQIEEIEIGDGMWVVQDGREMVAEVVKSELTEDDGLFNPQTMHGDIVVDGVVATCYTRTIPIRVAHSALTPVRALYEVLHRAFGSTVELY